MALNLTRQLCFHRGFPHRYSRGMNHHSRYFRSTARKRVIEEFLGGGAASAKPEGIKVLSQLERLSIVETELAIRCKTINSGLNRIETWMKLMITFGGGTVLFGFGSLAYKVMVYDIAAAEKMEDRVERIIERTMAAFEQRTESKLESLRLSTKSEMDNLKRLLEQSIRK
ncbi:hypothetical protein HOY80DRAFT_1100113 [Tuber brumale]|nr:hypothetical protein HOY80DRAFT_1100113 [Tuber brumale]